MTCAAPTLACSGGACHACVAVVASGGAQTCAIRADGSLWCWGDNSVGELGTGGMSSSSPVQVTALTTAVTQVSAADLITCARTSDGSAWCWGVNDSGQIGNGTTTNAPMPARVVNVPAIAGLSADRTHSCAFTTGNVLYCWGDNTNGDLGNGTTARSTVPVAVSTGSNVVGVSTQDYYTCAWKSDHTLWCWGRNVEGQLGIGTKSTAPPYGETSPVLVQSLGSTVVEAGAGAIHACARKIDGSVWCWGSAGLVGTADGAEHLLPVQVVTDVAQLSVGEFHTCVRKTDASLWCWGSNTYGELGTGDTTDRPVPTLVLAGGSVAGVSAGVGIYPHTCVLKTDGSIWCWGNNSSGELGNRMTSTAPQTTPVQSALGCP
ncbi:MAG TPA: hypothetical protein VKN99_25870 [Polyangia bacterium]|nr:hypothetical protein [Polyangia bacterium]